MWKVVVAVCVLAAGVLAQQDQRTIYEYLQDGNHTKLLELIIGAGLADEFRDTNSLPITLFAPTDAAIAAFEASGSPAVVEMRTNVTFLQNLLNGHVSDETILSLFVRDGLTKASKSGTALTFSVLPGGVKAVDGAVMSGEVILANGVVHSIDRVLTPVDGPVSTVIAESDSQFRDLYGLLVIARLVDTLTTGGPFTVFAPTDSAFAGASLAPLLADRDALTNLLLNHVVAGQYWSSSLSDGLTLTTLGGQQIVIGVSGGVTVDNTQVIQANIGASNGVIHAIDGIL